MVDANAFRNVIPPTIQRTRANNRLTAIVVCSLSAIVTAAAIAMGSVRGPDISRVLPVAAALWSTLDILTGVLIFGRFATNRRPAFAAVACAFLLVGLLTWPYIVAFIGLPAVPAGDLPAQQLVPALFIAWHILFPAIIVMAALYERNHPVVIEPEAVSPTIRAFAIGTAVLAIAVSVILISLRGQLPSFVIGDVFQPVYQRLFVVTMFLDIAAIVALLLRSDRLSGLSLWLTVTLFVAALDMLLHDASALRASYAWDAGKLMTIMTSTVILGQTLASMLSMYGNVAEITNARASRSASRLRALWQVVTSEGVSDGNHLQMLLDVATSNVRERCDVVGVLSHLEAGMIVVDLISKAGDGRSLRASAEQYAVGTQFPLSDDLHAPLFASGRVEFWNQLDRLASYRCAKAGWKSAIGTTIQIAGQTYFILFGILEAQIDDRFEPGDTAFIDVIASNISNRLYQRNQQERLQFQQEHDTLTGLENRKMFRLRGRMAAAEGALAGIVVIDLDDFHSVNQLKGQMIGDEVLVEIGASLRQVNERNLVARIGGDEFGILLMTDTSTDDVVQTHLHAYTQVFSRPFNTGDRDGTRVLELKASIGAAALEAGTPFELALTRAEIALETVKQNGGHSSMLFGPELEVAVIERSLERGQILSALEAEEFFLDYQPIVNLQLDTVVAVEALIRWRHPERGLLAPGKFLHAVHREELLRELTLWIVRRVSRDIEASPLPESFRCYINVPSTVLEAQSVLLNMRQLLLSKPGLASRLGIELTETDAMQHVEQTIETLKQLRTLGLMVAIDDFGTGYSSLSYLKRLPIDIVKLDKTFISGLPTDEKDIGLAKLFLDVAKQFSLVSVGEGIENAEQAEWLRAFGCMLGQGFYFARPMPWSDVMQRLG